MIILGASNLAPPLTAAALALLLGVLVLVAMRSNRPRGKRRWALMVVAFFAGPLVAVAVWALGVFLVGNYANNEERLDVFWPCLMLGVLVGIVTALGVLISNVIPAASSDKVDEHEPRR